MNTLPCCCAHSGKGIAIFCALLFVLPFVSDDSFAVFTRSKKAMSLQGKSGVETTDGNITSTPTYRSAYVRKPREQIYFGNVLHSVRRLDVLHPVRQTGDQTVTSLSVPRIDYQDHNLEKDVRFYRGEFFEFALKTKHEDPASSISTNVVRKISFFPSGTVNRHGSYLVNVGAPIKQVNQDEPPLEVDPVFEKWVHRYTQVHASIALIDPQKQRPVKNKFFKLNLHAPSEFIRLGRTDDLKKYEDYDKDIHVEIHASLPRYVYEDSEDSGVSYAAMSSDVFFNRLKIKTRGRYGVLESPVSLIIKDGEPPIKVMLSTDKRGFISTWVTVPDMKESSAYLSRSESATERFRVLNQVGNKTRSTTKPLLNKVVSVYWTRPGQEGADVLLTSVSSFGREEVSNVLLKTLLEWSETDESRGHNLFFTVTVRDIPQKEETMETLVKNKHASRSRSSETVRMLHYRLYEGGDGLKINKPPTVSGRKK